MSLKVLEGPKAKLILRSGSPKGMNLSYSAYSPRPWGSAVGFHHSILILASHVNWGLEGLNANGFSYLSSHVFSPSGRLKANKRLDQFILAS
jgi:hypothetical protein